MKTAAAITTVITKATGTTATKKQQLQQQQQQPLQQQHHQQQQRVRDLTSSWLAYDSRKSEVSNLYASLIRHEEIGDLQVAMDDVARVKILKTAQHLQHNAFDLRLGKRRGHVVQQGGDVLFAIPKMENGSDEEARRKRRHDHRQSVITQPNTYVMTRNMLSKCLPTATSLICTTFSCRRLIRSVISRKVEIGSPSFSRSIRTRFNATI